MASLELPPASASQVPRSQRGTTALCCGLLTCFRERRAHSSKVSAASSFPWRLYRAPRFLRVVFTVGLQGDRRRQGEWFRGGVRMWPNAEHLASICRLCRNPKHHKSKRTEEARGGGRGKAERHRFWHQEPGQRSSRDYSLSSSLPAYFAGLVPPSILRIGCAALPVPSLGIKYRDAGKR